MKNVFFKKKNWVFLIATVIMVMTLCYLYEFLILGLRDNQNNIYRFIMIILIFVLFFSFSIVVIEVTDEAILIRLLCFNIKKICFENIKRVRLTNRGPGIGLEFFSNGKYWDGIPITLFYEHEMLVIQIREKLQKYENIEIDPNILKYLDENRVNATKS